MNMQFNYSVGIMLIAVFTSGNVILLDAVGMRLPFQAIMIGLILIYFYQSSRVKINKSGFVVLLLAFTNLIGEIVIRQDILDVFGYLLLAAITMALLLMSPKAIMEFVIKLNYLNCFFALCAIFALALSFTSPAQTAALFENAPYYNSSFLPGLSWRSLLSHADTTNIIFGIPIPRVSAYLSQVSLVPAYFLLPLGLYLAFSPKKSAFVMITIFLYCIITFGGNVYVSILIGVFIFSISRYIPRVLLLIMPFICLVIASGFLAYLTFDLYDADTLKNISRAVGYSFEDSVGTEGAVVNRLSSGVQRLVLMGFQVIGFFDSFPFPAEAALINFSIGGLAFTNGLRGGVIAFVLTIIMFIIMFNGISYSLKQCKRHEISQRLGFALIYSLIFQAFFYNDFGFSTYYGFIMFVIIITLTRLHLLNQDDNLKKIA